MSDTSMTDTEQSECGLCGETPAPHLVDVQNEVTGEMKRASFCGDCHEKLLAYNRGEEVEWAYNRVE